MRMEEKQAEEIRLSAAHAKVAGVGINTESEVVDTVYEPTVNAVINMGTDSTVIYTVPENVEGVFDIYLDISKSPFAFGTTPVSILVNGKKEYVMPAGIVSCRPDFSDIFEMGKFMMAQNVVLKQSDTITIKGKPGFEMEFGGKRVSSMSSVGDVYLYPTGTAVAIGYGKGVVHKAEKVNASDFLSGLRIVWLGSSVTFGMKSGGYSMADAIEEKHAATECLKYAVSGTTLVNDGPTSFVERLKEIAPHMDMDLLVIQLSSNDATQKKPLGKISESRDLEDFDDTTVIGAMEYMIAYAKKTWDCDIVFYTGTYFACEQYEKMVEALTDIQKKWQIGIVDLWNRKEMTALYGTEQYKSYMGDEIHPLYDGYVKWWMPKFEEDLTEFVKRRKSGRVFYGN